MPFGKHYKRFFTFAIIPLFVFFVVLLVPFGQGFFLTFTDWNGFEFTSFTGIDNYVKSFADESFWATLVFTALFVVVSLVLVNVVAFSLALLVTAKLRSSNIFLSLIHI